MRQASVKNETLDVDSEVRDDLAGAGTTLSRRTFLQVLAFDGYSFVIYLGIRDIYIGRDINKRVERLKQAYRAQYNTEI